MHAYITASAIGGAGDTPESAYTVVVPQHLAEPGVRRDTPDYDPRGGRAGTRCRKRACL